MITQEQTQNFNANNKKNENDLIKLSVKGKSGNMLTKLKKSHIEKAVEYINTKYYHAITPLDVAQEVKLDEKYLYSLFKTYYNLSIQQYINNLKIEKSKELLIKTKLNVTKVALSVGIKDALYFSKFFKKKVGVSPKQFRKENLVLNE